MSVQLDPSNSLGFPRPLTQLVKRTLTIHNPNPSPIAFKVKTTAPKQYCVRPNSGRVEAGESVEVQVLLQPLSQEPPPHAKCKDKFLVQSAFIAPDEEIKTLAELWAQTEKTNKSAIHEQKLKCAYLAAEDGSTGANGIPEEPEDTTLDQSKLIDESRPTLAFQQANDGLSHWTTAPERAIDPNLFRNGGHSYYEIEEPQPKIVVKPAVHPSADDPQHPRCQPQVLIQQAVFAAAESSPTPTSPAVPNVKSSSAPVALGAITTSVPATANSTDKAVPSLTAKDIAAVNKGVSPADAALEKSLESTTSDSDKLAVALQEIEKLRAQLAESAGPQVTGLRKRGGAAAQAGAETTVEKTKQVVNAAQGVPIEIVGGLLLAVFALTYLFF